MLSFLLNPLLSWRLTIAEVCHYGEDDVWHPCRYYSRNIGIYGECGRYGLQHKDRVLYEFLQKEAEVLCQIAGKLQDSITNSRLENREIPEKTMERLQSVKEEQRLNEEALSYFTI